MDNRPIGVFDSGVGGMTVAKEILANLPGEEIVYYGDTGRAPYGPRTTQEITDMTCQICDFLMSRDVKALVVACNTICVSCIDLLREKYPVPVFDVIGPGVDAALAVAKKGIGLFATAATVASGAHRDQILEHGRAMGFRAKACPIFVPIIEEGLSGTEIAYHAALEYLREFDDFDLDTLILGCTHYPIMKAAVERAAGPKVKVVDPSLGTALALKAHLEANGLQRDGTKPANHIFHMSGDEAKFREIMQVVFGTTYPTERVVLG